MPTSVRHRSAAALAAERREIVRQRSLAIAQNEQWFVDAEVRATRRDLLGLARRRTQLPALGFLDADCLSIADRPTVYRAIIDAAVDLGGAASVDLQVYDAETDSLRIADHRGFDAQFLAFFADVRRSTPSACAVAWATGAPVLVDRVVRSPIFAGQPTLEPLMDAGSRAVASYPLLRPCGGLAGVLSFHYPKLPMERARAALITRAAARALSVLM